MRLDKLTIKAQEALQSARDLAEQRAHQEIVSGRSVDVMEIDGASNTGVDDVRTLREGARYMPTKGKRKIYIIDEVHARGSSEGWGARRRGSRSRARISGQAG